MITLHPGDLVVVLNATPQRQDQRIASAAGTGTFTVPPRTVAVFTRAG